MRAVGADLSASFVIAGVVQDVPVDVVRYVVQDPDLNVPDVVREALLL